MTTASFTPARTLPRPGARSTAGSAARPVTTALRAIRAFGGAAVGVVLLGRYAQEAGVKDPRPAHVGEPD
ncbi:hypothetical protein J7E93_34110 [Streptomyces sp. ISL-36]|uniref:hypothetical protein n=1 Tax=Streptomyces sp. ISL-36 TaxID=2819182 RepID=UPI001BEB9A4B|nr:hypothetical protein [Streptomyces sp. ISL-36]MBT2445039.1 hypothetical protein [Streptomyces sp. ISL-36]